MYGRKMQIHQAETNQICVRRSDSPAKNGKLNGPSRWTTAAPEICGNVVFLSTIHALVRMEARFLERVIFLTAWNFIQ
jgi:hypothetical protein